MSINSSDFSKQSMGVVTTRQDQRADEQFRALREANAKVIQNSADSNRADANSSNSQGSSNSPSVDPKQIENANIKMSQLNVHLSFEMTEDRKNNIVKVLDQTTGDVVRQMPTEEFLKMSERIDAIMNQLSDVKGTLVNSEV
ncbi:MAG: flagellar protein FlaG [Marinomonas foliarum]|jgi:flagellar protein FlaG|uniref:Flagellar protein FlaG n=1 Tax=Marinomonas foliarum TaxID=491950 RepID=A0A369AJ58_9GAMM|nr:flagellar protein FlaG [Marinomonas foliarum]QRV23115.1 flagellar protein FlaG [Marinomonas foliarum]RCX07474.1 flagellar protein FlaG [Marinomonas foliarum]